MEIKFDNTEDLNAGLSELAKLQEEPVAPPKEPAPAGTPPAADPSKGNPGDLNPPDDESDDEPKGELAELYQALAEQIVEDKVISGLPADFKPTPEGIRAAIEAEVQGREKAWKAQWEENETNKRFMEFIAAGGDVKKFQETEPEVDWAKVDSDFDNLKKDANNLKVIVAARMTEEGHDQKTINARLNVLAKSPELLESEAKFAATTLKNSSEARRQSALKQLQDQREKKLRDEAEFKEKRTKKIMEGQIGIFNPTKEERVEFGKYMENPPAPKNQEEEMDARILFHYLQFKKFDLDQLSKLVTTAKNRKLDDKLKDSAKLLTNRGGNQVQNDVLTTLENYT